MYARRDLNNYQFRRLVAHNRRQHRQREPEISRG
jgi:hypothetical protein